MELATGKTLVEQAGSPAGAAAAAALAAFVLAASTAPLLLGRVKPEAAFPSENDSYPTSQLPTTWTAVAEKLNGRVAMVRPAAAAPRPLPPPRPAPRGVRLPSHAPAIPPLLATPSPLPQVAMVAILVEEAIRGVPAF